MLTLPPDSELFQMVPSLEQSHDDQKRYLQRFRPHSKHPHLYYTDPLMLFSPPKDETLCSVYEKELAAQEEWISKEVDDFSGDAQSKVNELERHAHSKISTAISKFLRESKGRIDAFPFPKPRVLFEGEWHPKNNPQEVHPVMIIYDPFEMLQHFTLKLLQDYLTNSYPIEYVNPYKTWVKVHKMIFCIAIVLFFLSNVLLFIPGLQFTSFGVQAFVVLFGLLNLIPLSVFRKKSKQWEDDDKSRIRYTVYQDLFTTIAQSLHLELRFHRLWAKHIAYELPADFDKWEKQLHSLVDKFNALPPKPIIRH